MSHQLENSPPEIRINFADLLFTSESKRLAGDQKMASYEQYLDWTEAYRKAWKKHEKTIVSALMKIVDLEFYKPVIDVSTAPFFIPKSDPLIIGFRNEPDQFVDTLTHELCHVLLTDNTKYSLRNEGTRTQLDLLKEWQQLFGIESFNTVVHVPVHAMLKYIYLDVLDKPSRLLRDIRHSKKLNSRAYTEAWEYVEQNDYKKITENVKELYKKVPA